MFNVPYVLLMNLPSCFVCFNIVTMTTPEVFYAELKKGIKMEALTYNSDDKMN